MQTKATLIIDIRNYWHPGTGRGSGSHLDNLVERDRFGLPFISGKMLKGLVRDAVNRLEIWNRLDGYKKTETDTLVTSLFGSPSFREDDNHNPISRDNTVPGRVRFSDGVLPDDLRCWLAHPEQHQERNEIFRDFYSTAIQYSTGIARKNSLRGMELALPLTLRSSISWIGTDDKYKDCWQEVISESLPLIRAVGGHRTRGFGRAVLDLVGEGGQQV